MIYGATFATADNDCGCTTCGNHGKADICSECAFDSKWEAKPMTNGDRIRAMTDEELAKFIFSLADGENDHDVACFGCINYDTHHSDPAYKCAGLYECEGCPNEGIGLDVEKWLKQPAEKS